MSPNKYSLEMIRQYIDKSLELAKIANVRTGEQILLIHQAQAMMKYNKAVDKICTHPNAKPMTASANPLDEGYKCPNCGAWLDEELNVVRMPDDEIPY